MSEEEDIKRFNNYGDFLSYAKNYRMVAPVTDVIRKISERSAIYLEFMAAAFLKETGLKASEVELICFYDPMREEFHWKFEKKESQNE